MKGDERSGGRYAHSAGDAPREIVDEGTRRTRDFTDVSPPSIYSHQHAVLCVPRRKRSVVPELP